MCNSCTGCVLFCVDILNVLHCVCNSIFITAQCGSLLLSSRTCWQAVWEVCSTEASEQCVFLTLAARTKYLLSRHGLEDQAAMLAPGGRHRTALQRVIPSHRKRSTTPEVAPQSARSDERSPSVKFTWSARLARVWAPCTVQTWSRSWMRRASSWCCSVSAKIPPFTGWWAESRCTRSSWNCGRNRKPNLVCSFIAGAFENVWV